MTGQGRAGERKLDGNRNTWLPSPEFAGSISLETVRQILKKTNLWKKKEWCIPKLSGEFVARWRTCWTFITKSTTGSVR